MNTVERKSVTIRQDDDGDYGHHSSRVTLEGDARKDRKKHKKRPKDGSTSKSSSDRSERRSNSTSESSSQRKSSRKHSSSKSSKDKKKRKHKRRPSSPSRSSGQETLAPEKEKPAPVVEKTVPDSSNLPPSSEEDDGDLSSDSSVDSAERCTKATVEVFSRDGVMERAASQRIQSTQDYDDSFSSSSDESLSEESVKVEKPRRSNNSSSNSSSIDRHKKEVVAALMPDQFMAVQRKPPGRSSRSSTSTTSTRSEEFNKSSVSTSRQPAISIRNVSSGSTRQVSSRQASRRAPSQHTGVARGAPPAPLPSTTPRSGSSDKRGPAMDQHKKDMIKELCPDQFMTVSRKPAKLGAPRPPSSGPNVTTASPRNVPPGSTRTGLTTRPTSPDSFGPPSSSSSPPPSEPIQVAADPFTKDDRKSTRNFKLPGFNRKGKKKGKEASQRL